MGYCGENWCLEVLKWGSVVLMVLKWGYLDVQMVLEWVLCLCVWVRCVVCYADMFCLVPQLCSCEV